MFLGHIEPDAAVHWINQRSWLSLEDCMRIACADKTHMGIIRRTRYYPIISDEVLQKVWGAYIEKKNECEKVDKRLNELKILFDEEMGQFSLGLRFLMSCPSLISNQVRRSGLSLLSRLLKYEVKGLRSQFLQAREEMYILEPIGGQEEYKKLPVYLEDIGIFEEPFKLCKDKFSKEFKELRELGKFTDDQRGERACFLYMVSVELCWRAAGRNTSDSPLAPFFEAVPDLFSKALEILKGNEIRENSQEEVYVTLCAACPPAPVARGSRELLGTSVPVEFLMRKKNTATGKITPFSIRRKGGWLMITMDDMSTTNKLKETPLFTETGEKTESYNQLSELLIKKQCTTAEGTFILS